MCQPARTTARPQPRQAATRSIRVDAGHKALLLGTALVSTLLFGSAFTASEATAQARKVEFREVVVNDAERTTGIVVELAPMGLLPAPQNTTEPDQSYRLIMEAAVINSGAITAPGYAAIGTVIYNETIVLGNEYSSDGAAVAQRTIIENETVIDNRAALTADYGFHARTVNRSVVLYNDGATSVIEADDFTSLTQVSRIDQVNEIATAIRIENNGDIVSDDNRAAILNNEIEMRNQADVLNLSSGDGNSLTQISDVDQANLLENTITIETRRAIVAGNIGLDALVTNTGAVLYNGCPCNENLATGYVDEITQLTYVSQTNEIVTAIAIENSGDIVAGGIGINAGIDNQGVSLVNEGEALNQADLGGYITQASEIGQTNIVANAIIINNEAAIQAASGIQAIIVNDSPEFVNYLGAENSTGLPPPHSIDVEQANIITSSIAIGNSGDIVSSDVGIVAFTQNYIPPFGSTENQAFAENDTSSLGNGLDSQSIHLSQANIIANATAIENSGNIDSGIAGIAVVVLNQVTFSPNVSGAADNDAFSTSDDLVQSLNVEQYNALVSKIGIENSGTIAADATGISALIINDMPSSSGSTAANTAVPRNIAAGTISGYLTQSMESTQTAIVASDIIVENLGTIDADIGILAAVSNELTIGNFGGFDNASFGSVEGAVTQSLSASQSSTATNTVVVENAGMIRSGAYGIIADITNDIASYNYAAAGNEAFQSARQSLDFVQTNTIANDITIVNRGEISADGIAILANIQNNVSFNNALCLACNYGPVIVTQSSRLENSIAIVNSGSIRGGEIGVAAGIVPPTFFDFPVIDPSINNTDRTVESRIVIENTGLITATSLLAIDTYGARTTIINTGGGVIEGFVDLTDRPDRFLNQVGGTFEARRTSDFGDGNDLFRNDGTVHTASDPSRRETTTFVNLERFENRGLISLVDGRVGDTFTIMNTSANARDLSFVASGNSALAVDAFLSGPGSVADEFIVYGDISGRTALHVNNTNPNPGAAGAVIPVIVAESDQVKSDSFYLAHPIDTGFFNYDLFFRETGSGVFELRSFVGASSLLLPQLVTGTQDIWHATSSTWFDRTADLRVLLAGGGSPIAYDPTGGYENGAAAGPAVFTPAVWARGGSNWLDREGSETVNAFGNNYRFNLDRDLELIDWQMGLDLGKRDFLSPGDILVFGVLGGFVNADLDYDQLARAFDFEGGQVGGYATYLKGRLFVDTLLNVHLLDLETATQGFPSSLDATTLGLRTDTGYRFGSFNGGAFIEPLATLAVLWSDIDGFTSGGNKVSFDDEANVRGRLGLRVGTSYPAWTGTTVEPFVIGSLWGNLSGDNQATLTSSGTTFRFEDDLDDVWGEVSAGVNFFNPSANTAVFAKLDVTFGDDVDGIGGKAGMRVSW